jgi:response regulator of citrate/malate metabolism
MNNNTINLMLVEYYPQGVFFIQDFFSSISQNYKLIWNRTLLDVMKNTAAPVDLILLNPHLPDSLGITALKGLLKKFPHVPIYVINEMANQTLRDSMLNEGAADFFVLNDEDPDNFCEKICNFIDHYITRKNSA